MPFSPTMAENDKHPDPVISPLIFPEHDESVKRIVTDLVANIDTRIALVVEEQIKTLKETH